MLESKTQIDTLECELSEENLITIVGGLSINGNVDNSIVDLTYQFNADPSLYSEKNSIYLSEHNSH